MWNNYSFKIVKAIFSYSLALHLVACGGEDSEELESESVIALPSNLELETLQFEQHDLDFNKNKTGPYEIQVNAATQDISFTATNSSETTNLRYQMVNSEGGSAAVAFNSGEQVNVSLAEGNNVLRVFAGDADSNLFVLYTVHINKSSASAALQFLNLVEFEPLTPETSAAEPAEQLRAFLEILQNPPEEQRVAYSPEFSSDVYDYSASVEYDHCGYGLQLNASKPDNDITVNDRSLSDRGLSFGNLDVGENFIDIFVASGEDAPPSEEPDAADSDAENTSTKLREERYTVKVTRSAPTEAQENQNAHLRNLSVEGHELNFLCSLGVYSLDVNKATRFLRFTVEPEIDGVKVLYEDQDFASNVPKDIELEPDTESINLAVESLDGSVTNVYRVLLNRLDTNPVVVDTTEDLQYALQNANPNDEIRIKPGVYEGQLGLGTSGSDEAGFYSPRSGSRLLPIILTADETDNTADNPVILKLPAGANTAENQVDVLQLSGNYWEISNLTIEGGDNSVHLKQANDITLNTLSVAGFSQRGVAMHGSRNQLSNTEIAQGAADSVALVSVSGDADTNTVVSNNLISRNQLQASGSAAAVLLNVLSENTELLSNDIRSSGTAPLVQARGNNTTVRWNQFISSGSASQVIAFTQETIAEQLWGTQGKIYQNTLARNKPELLFVQANSAQEVEASENHLSALTHDEDEHTSVNYEGGNVNVLDTPPPGFRISPSESPENCLSITQPLAESESYIVDIQPCGEGEAFYWDFEFSSSGYVYIKNRSQENGYLTSRRDFVSLCPNIANATSFVGLADNVSGFAQQWAIHTDGESYWFSNKFNDEFALSVSRTTYGTNTPAVVCNFTDNERQKFILKP